jgi:hypothetical protein
MKKLLIVAAVLGIAIAAFAFTQMRGREDDIDFN